ncbi:hypothetical protein sS8_0510 [Methylocaldum marinum]|uniref:Uncharacterized protein n=1 Tax=Methylocaldum marinum TaxID=1432792 RepID=A0A250KLK0_9GAMM|nr:DUF1525 domain-containing protein [Methylocaldum marinum]BBA32475.1 hypothetical protein sS8_0510 [Methylocaldum marinum]
MLTDEAHIVATNPLLAPDVVKISKMWRRYGACLWLATQNLQDFPDAARRMLNMMEWWLTLSAPPVPADIGPAAVEVFTDPSFPASGVETLRNQRIPIDIFDLAAPRRIEAVLSAGLPANEAAALAIARQRLEGQGSRLAAQLETAYEGHARALSYGLARYPAIVFDRGAAVVYR